MKTSPKSKEKDKLKQLAKDQIEKEKGSVTPTNTSTTEQQSEAQSPYFLKNGYWCRTKMSRDGGEIIIKLCDFTAEITARNTIDDGKEVVNY